MQLFVFVAAQKQQLGRKTWRLIIFPNCVWPLRATVFSDMVLQIAASAEWAAIFITKATLSAAWKLWKEELWMFLPSSVWVCYCGWCAAAACSPRWPPLVMSTCPIGGLVEAPSLNGGSTCHHWLGCCPAFTSSVVVATIDDSAWEGGILLLLLLMLVE